jgi:hypothetical protein
MERATSKQHHLVTNAHNAAVGTNGRVNNVVHDNGGLLRFLRDDRRQDLLYVLFTLIYAAPHQVSLSLSRRVTHDQAPEASHTCQLLLQQLLLLALRLLRLRLRLGLFLTQHNVSEHNMVDRSAAAVHDSVARRDGCWNLNTQHSTAQHSTAQHHDKPAATWGPRAQ